MPAGAGIFKKLFGKDKKPLNTQRVVISDTQKYGFQDEAGGSQNISDLEPVNISNSYEESFLEDTPAQGVIFDKSTRGKRGGGKSKETVKPAFEKVNTMSPKTEGYRGNNAGSPKTEGFRGENTGSPKTEGFRGENTGSPKTESFRGSNTGSPKSRETLRGENTGYPKSREAFRGDYTERRYKAGKKSFSGVFSIFSAIPGIFKRKSKTSNSSALEFASSRKRLGKKGRRNRHILIYAGTGLVAAVITLAIVFVPGLAAPTVTQSPGVSQSATQGAYVAVNSADVSGSTVSGGPEVSPSVSLTPTATPIPTTPQDTVAPFIDLDEEVQKFRVEADEYYNEMGYSNNHYKYTPEEKHMLSQVIYREARGEGLKGMIAVGNVVMNRVLSSRFPGNTIKYVLSASNQFAYYPDAKTNLWSNRAANLVLDYEDWVVPQNIFFFKVPSSADPTANWASHVYVLTIGNHAFYTDKKYGRTGKIPPKLFERIFEWPTMGCKKENRVEKLQYILNKLGYSKVKADGYFGQDTKDAIIDFQKKHGLDDDGIAGKNTLKKLILAFGEENYYEKFCK